MSIAFETQ